MSYRIEPVGSSRSGDFSESYAALAAEFGPRGELERREIVARWTDAPRKSDRELLRHYHLLVARDAHGALAGVRDCHVVVEPASKIAIVYLAHSLVLPPYRRSGLGARFRSAPVALERRAMEEAGMGHDADLVLAAEMEPAMMNDPGSLVRLAAYGKDGFAAIAPAALPYCQPDFRGLEVPRAIPLLAVVRWVGHERAALLPKRLARAFVRHLHSVFATHVRADHLSALEARTLAALEAAPSEEVALLPLPRTIEDRAVLAALTREAVLPFFPVELR